MVQHVFMYILTLHVHFLSNLCYNQCYLAYFSIEYMCTLSKRDKLQLRMPPSLPSPLPSFPVFSLVVRMHKFADVRAFENTPKAAAECSRRCAYVCVCCRCFVYITIV